MTSRRGLAGEGARRLWGLEETVVAIKLLECCKVMDELAMTRER